MPLRLKLVAGIGIAAFSWVAAHLLTGMLLARPERFLDEQVALDLKPIPATRPAVPGPAPTPDPPLADDPPPVAGAPTPPAPGMPQRACEVTKADGTVLHCSVEQLALQPESPAPTYAPPGYAMQSGYPVQAAQPEDEEPPPQWSEPDVTYAVPGVIVERSPRRHREPGFRDRGPGGPRIPVRPAHLHP
ncbi:MAG TPA: hypothetical protein VMB48_12970 [Steroidobacteraceae bacterium]|nr:hypothetical protein [Steroidobacteraceae bacterium]